MKNTATFFSIILLLSVKLYWAEKNERKIIK
jgi:hypothetical protein